MRPPFPPPPADPSAGDANVAAVLRTAFLRPVDDVRAEADIAMLAAAAKANANVTMLGSRRERMFKQVAAAAAVVVVASGAGFSAAQLGGNSGDVDNPEMPLALEQPDTNTVVPPVVDVLGDEPADVDVVEPQPADPGPAPAPAPAPTPAPAPAPAPAPDPTVGDAGEADTIDDFVRDDIVTDDDVCDPDATDETCDVDDADVPSDGTDPRDLLRDSRFGTN